MKDFLNKKHRRTELNTPIGEYNCGGYALRTFSWYMPYESSEARENHVNELRAEEFSISDIYKRLLQEDKRALKRAFGKKIRFITKPEEVKEDEELVVYKFFIDFENEEENLSCNYSDFHFRVFRGGVWKEKIGDDSIEVVEDMHFQLPWFAECGIYDSFPLMMAIKI